MNALPQSPVGAWLVEVTMPGQAAFPGLLTFNSDGTLMATESPSPFESTGHGSWQMKDGGAVACTFVALFGSAEGKNTGQIKAVGMLHHDGARVGWTGPFKIRMVDSAGQVTFAESSTFTLTRIAVELLA